MTVTETDGSTDTSAAFTVSLSAASAKTITVDYATAASTATSNIDYTAIASTTLTFSAGQLSKTVTVVVKGDDLDEDNETFSVNLSGATNSTISDNQGTGTINDNDSPPAISIDDVTVTETNGSTDTSVVFTVSLSAASGKAISVDYATSAGTASSPADFTAISSTSLAFSAGQTSKTVTVVVKGDDLDEDDELFYVNLSSPANATIADNQGVATITDNDATPTISFTSASQIASESGSAVTVTAQLSSVSGRTVTVPVVLSGTASLTNDYTISTNPATIAAGSSTAVFTITPVNDTDAELLETAVLSLGAVTNATPTGTTAHTVTIGQSDIQLNGQVVDNVTSNPVSSATVTVQDSNLNTIITTTDASGNFSLVSDFFNQASSYSPDAAKSGYITTSAISVTVSGAVNSVSPNPVILVRQAGDIAGKVVDDHSLTGLPGVTVSATDSSSTLRTAITDANGDFTLSSSSFFLGESYTVNFSKTDYFANSSSATISVTGANTISGNPLHLYINGTITGKAVKDIGGNAPGVTVSVTDSNSAVISTTTDASGNFTLVGTGSQPNTSFRKGVNYTVSFTSVDYNNASRAASNIQAGANQVDASSPDPAGQVTLVTNKDGNHVVTGKVVDYWEQLVGATELPISSARVEIDDESTTVSATAAANGTFSVPVNVIATKTYTLRILTPVVGAYAGKYTGADTVTTTTTSFVATNVAPSPPPSSTQDVGTKVLHPIGIRAVIAGSNQRFSGSLKQTHEKFLTEKSGFTMSARNCSTCDKTDLGTSSTFFLHQNDSSPLSIPVSLLPSSNNDPTRGNPSITDIHSNYLPVNGASIRGAIQEGLRGESRSDQWGLNGAVFYHFYVTDTGSFSIETEGSDLDTYMYLYNSSGTQLAANNDGGTGTNARITYSVSSTGWYHIKVIANVASAGGLFDVKVTGPPQVSGFTGTKTTNDIVLSWYDNATRLVYIAAENEQSSSGTLTLSKLEAVNSLARGVFSGTMKAIDTSATAKTIANGYFNIVRSE